jgi:hypothetical protein
MKTAYYYLIIYLIGLAANSLKVGKIQIETEAGYRSGREAENWSITRV